MIRSNCSAALCAATVTLLGAAAPSARVTPPPEPTIQAAIGGFGVEVGVSRSAPGAAGSTGGDARPVNAGSPPPPRHEYRSVVGCPGNSPDGSTDLYCNTAMSSCPRGTGPLRWIYRREIGPPPGAWTVQDSTCQPGDIPATSGAGEAELRAAVEEAFATTPLATPTARVQPPGGATLVNLPTYFQLTWPTTPGADGYAPGHIRSLTLLGQDVQLRIRAASHTYDFADGTRLGPTTSAGGPYPTGGITHTYTKSGTYAPTATTVLTADYRLADGPWQPITGTATRTTTLGPLQVLAVRPVLVVDNP